MNQTKNEAVSRAFAVDAAYEERLIDALYELEDGPVRNLFIDVVRGGEEMSDTNDRTQHAADRIDALCETFGVQTTGAWSSVLMEGANVIYARRMERRGMSLGTFITKLAMDRLPIEDNPDDAMVESEITLRAEGEHEVCVNIGGHIWKNHCLDGVESTLLDEMTDEDIMSHPDSTSLLEWENTYTADILPIKL